MPTEDGTAIASFKFIDCVERSIEAQHAYTAKAVVYRKIGMVGISCNLRLPEVSRRIDGDPTGGMQEEIIRCIDLVRNPENIAQDFCLNGHLDIHRLRHKFNTEGKRTHKTKMWKLVARILYMADSRAQNYSAISIARDFHTDTTKKKMSRIKANCNLGRLSYRYVLITLARLCLRIISGLLRSRTLARFFLCRVVLCLVQRLY